MLPKDWLKQFFSSRGLVNTDGRALYRYNMNCEEFATAKNTLSSFVSLGIENLSKVNGWNAAFVIYAAEWWRREYDGSVWSWEKVFSSFGADAKELNTVQRNFVVEYGLHYWRREVRKVIESEAD